MRRRAGAREASGARGRRATAFTSATVGVIVATVCAATFVPPPAGAVVLDPQVFDACASVKGVETGTPSRSETRASARAFAALSDRTAKRRLATALKAATTAKQRRKAASAAYVWCDEDAGAYQSASITLGVGPSVQLVDADVVTISGTSSPGATVTVSVTPGSRTVTATADPAGAFSAQLAGVPLGESNVTLSAVAPMRYPGDPVRVQVRRVESEGAFKASTREVPSDELKKDPAGLKGTRIYTRGEVFQYDARTGLTSMLVNVRVVNPGRFEFWTDPVLLRLESAAQGGGIDEDDIVEAWGEVQGAYSYSTAIGGTNTVPEIRVKYIGLLEKK